MTEKKQLLQWLKLNNAIKVKVIAQNIGINPNMLYRAMRYHEDILSDKHVPVLKKELEKYGYE